MRLFICPLLSPTGKGLTSWLSFVVSNCEFVTFPLVSCQVWYLIVSIPDLCTLTFFPYSLHARIQRADRRSAPPPTPGKSQVDVCFLINTGSDRPREAIGPKGFNCFSREVCTVLMIKTLNRALPLPEGMFWIRLRDMANLRQQYSYMISSNKHQKTCPHFHPGLPDLATLVVYELGRVEQRKTRRTSSHLR